MTKTVADFGLGRGDVPRTEPAQNLLGMVSEPTDGKFAPICLPISKASFRDTLLAIEAEAAPDLRADALLAADELHHYATRYGQPTAAEAVALDGARRAIRSALAAPAAAGLDVKRLIRAFYETPRKPDLQETEAEHIARAAARYAALREPSREPVMAPVHTVESDGSVTRYPSGPSREPGEEG